MISGLHFVTKKRPGKLPLHYVYHRGAHWKERVKMMRWWSDYLDQLREGAEVVPIKAAKR